MTRKLASATLFLVALTMSISAFAGSNSKSESVLLFHPAQVNGTTLPCRSWSMDKG